MHAPGARKTGRTHLLPLIDAFVQQGARADGGDTRLLLSKSSATRGSTLQGTNGGGSILPRPILGVLLSRRSTLGVLFPHEPMNMSGQLGKNLQKGGKADQEGASHPG